MRVLTGGGRAEINFSNFLQAPPSPLPFHDAAPEECRLPWKPFLGPLLGWMSGLLSLERLWQGESWECFEDGLHFCSVFSGRVFFLLSALWSCASVGDQLSVCPGSQRDPLAPGTRASRLLLALPRGQWEQKQQHRQGSKTRYNFPFRLRSAGAPRACSPRLIHALLVLTAPLPILGAVRSLGKPGQLRASAQLH